MKRTIGLLCGLATSALVSVDSAAQLENDCIEHGPFYNNWLCTTPNSTVTSSGTLTWSNRNVCVGETVTPPTLQNSPTFSYGTMRRLFTFDCLENPSYWKTNSLRYIPGPLYFTLPNSSVPTNIPSTFSTANTYTYWAKVDGRPSSLLGWWPGQGNANDLIYGNNGQLLNGTTCTVGQVGQGFNFDGVNDQVLVANSRSYLNFGANQDFSIEAWIKASTGNPSIMSIVDKSFRHWSTTLSHGYKFFLKDGKLGVGLASGPYSEFVSSTNLLDGNFHHVAVTLDRDSATGGNLYVDGQIVLTFDPRPASGTLHNWEAFRIGCAPEGRYFKGIIDELSIYQCALSTNDVQRIWTAGIHGKKWNNSPASGAELPAGCVCASVTATLGTVTIVVTPVFAKGINLAGDSVVIEGNQWLSYAAALNAGLSVTNARTNFENYAFSLNPTTNADTTSMLKTWLWQNRLPPLAQQATNQATLWVAGNDPISFLTATLSNVPPGFAVSNGSYVGWCLAYQDPIDSGTAYHPTLYYSYDLLPSHLQHTNWNKVNYILNHKQGDSMDVQGAIWQFIGGPVPSDDPDYFPPSATTTNIVNDANANGANFVPTNGQIAAVILDSGTGVQLTILEITNKPIEFTLSQTLANGPYQVFLWLVENETNNYRSLDVKLQGVTVATNVGDLTLGSWSKLGPYNATVTNGSLTLQMLRGTKGNPLLMGLAFYNYEYNFPPLVSIITPTNNAVFIEITNLALSASVTNGSGTVTNVEFFNKTTWLGATNSVGVSNLYYFTWTNRTAGIYPMTAKATDNLGLAGVSPITLVRVNSTNTFPTVWITYPTNNETFRASADITITASATPGSGTVTNVEFFVNGQLLGNDPDSPYSITECCWKSGSHQLTAKVTDALGFSSISTQINIVVAERLPSSGEGFWDPIFTIPVSTDRVNCMATYRSTLYCGMNFPFPGGGGSGIYKWDGTNWVGWDASDCEVAQDIIAMAANDSGVYYAEINDFTLSIRRKDGDGVHSVGENTALFCDKWGLPWTRPLHLKFIGPDLYLAGDFIATTNGTTSAQYLTKWNPTDETWEAVGNGLDGPVFAIDSFEGDLVVGGRFNVAGTHTNVHNVARLKGGVWVPLGGGVEGTNSSGDESGVYSLAACGTTLFVGGDFTIAGDLTNLNSIALWNGQEWQGIGQGVSSIPAQPEEVYSFAAPVVLNLLARGDAVFASGKFTAIWDQDGDDVSVSGIAKAVWSEAEQRWLWSDLDLGAFDTTYAPAAYSGDLVSMVLMESTNTGAYDVVVGGYLSFAGFGMTNLLLESQSPRYQNVARWSVGKGPLTNAPLVSISFPTNYAVFTNNPSSITVTATTVSSAAVAYVDFYENGSIFGTDSTSGTNYHTFNWINPAQGLHLLKAIAVDTNGIQGESKSVLISIESPTNAVVARDDSFTIPENNPTIVLPVLTNDTPATGFRISRLFQLRSSLGTTTVGHDGTYVSFNPFPRLFGTHRFAYTITNSSGASDSAWVTVNIRAQPTIQITAPHDEDRFGTNASITISGTTRDWDGSVSNVRLYTNGTQYGSPIIPAADGNFSTNWSQSTHGFYTFEAVATDDEGYTNVSTRITITLTNSTVSPNPPIAIISNLVNTVTELGAIDSMALPVIREGLFNLQGRAADPDTADAVAYAIHLFRPEDEDVGSGLSLEQLIEITEPYADITPGPLNYQGFHIGGDVSGYLGTLDLSNIPNGVYDIVLRVRGGTDQTNAIVRVQIDSSLKIGQFSFSEQDLVIPVNGIPLTVVRTYNSLKTVEGDFGFNWTYAINDMDVAIDEQRETVTAATTLEEDDPLDNTPINFSVRTGGGRNITLTLPDGQRTTFAYIPRLGGNRAFAEWTAPPGVHSKLTMNADNQIFFQPTLHFAAGFGETPYEAYDVPAWTLETPDGTKYEITRDLPGETPHSYFYQDNAGLFGPEHNYWIEPHPNKPRLSKIIQRTGDTIEINPASILHKNATGAVTRTIYFERDAKNRITEIRDPIAGTNGLPVVKYVYNQDSGNLIRVLRLVDRTTGSYTTNAYHYNHAQFLHYITSIDDSRGIPVARNEYDDSGRLTAVVDADGKRTEFVHNTTNRLERVIDRLGNTNTFVYDTRGNVTAITNALNQVTSFGYDTNNNQIAQTNALGTATETWTLYSFDDKGNQTAVVDSLLRTNSFSYNTNGNLLTQTDPLGNLTTNGYDASGNLTNTVQLDAQGNVVSQSSSRYENGHLVETRNGSNQVTATFAYDASGNLSSTTDANGFARSFGYDLNGNQTNTSYVWTPPGGGSPVTVTTSTEYDAQGRIIRSVDANGNTNRTVYKAIGKAEVTIDKFGNTNSFLYDTRGNLIQTTHPDGLLTRTVYDGAGRAFLTTDRNGLTATRTYFDAAGKATNVVRLTNVVVSIEAGPRSVLTGAGTPISTNSTEYLPSGWVKSRTGPDNQKTTYAYWPDGQLMYVTNALNQITFYKYDNAGRQEYVADALNRTNRFEYDAVGRVVRTVFHNGTYTSNYFNALGQRTVVRDQAGLLMQFGYNVSGQLTNVTKAQVRDPENSNQLTNPAWSYAFDQYGRLTVATDPKGRNTTNTYDAFGRQVARLLPMGGAGETNFYNALGQLTNRTDFKGQRTLFAYDKYGRVRAKFLFEAGATYPSNTVCYIYNQLGQLTNITERFGGDASTNDCDGYAAFFGLPGGGAGGDGLMASLAKVPGDVAGGLLAIPLLALALALVPREKRQQCAQAVREAWLRNVAQASCLRVPAASSREENRSGERRLRLPSLVWRTATVVTVIALIGNDPSLDHLWTAHAQCTIPSNSSTPTTRITTFSYDLEERLVQVNSPEGVLNYEYDLATGRHTRTCTANSEFTYQYDALGRLWKVNVLKRNGSTISTETTTYTYTAVGSRASLALPNGTVTNYAYDELNRLTGLTNRASDNSILSQFIYQLHGTGRRTNATEILKQEDGNWQTNTLSWAYDGIYRLTNEVCVSTVTGGSYTNAFAYDKAGNRVKKTRKVGSQTETINSFYNANDQLLREEITELGGTLRTNFYAYDANGSTIAKTNATASTSTAALYGYDLKNKLSSVTTAGSGVTNYFLYNDQGIRVRKSSSAGGNPTLYLVDANNHTGYAQVLEELTTLGGTPTRSYVLGDDVLAQATSTASYLLYDGHGSTRQMASNSGGVTSRYNYDAYGEMLGSSSPTPETSLRYCGEQFDTTLQMYNLRARYYDPSNGRFNQQDSFAGLNSDPETLHKYAYANLDPVNGADPSGLVDWTLIGTALTIGLITGLVTATIVGIDSALGGKDTGQIIFDAGTGFLIGFSVGALLTLIGPAAFAAIAPFVPYLLLLLGGWAAYDSFTHGLIAQGIFRIIVTIVSAGLANATVRAKVFQFTRFLWAKIFPPATPLPSFVGVPGSNLPANGDRAALYVRSTKQLVVGGPTDIHINVYIKAGLDKTVTSVADDLIGGFAVFENGQLVKFTLGGSFQGTTELADEAAAAVARILASQ